MKQKDRNISIGAILFDLEQKAIRDLAQNGKDRRKHQRRGYVPRRRQMFGSLITSRTLF